MTRLRLSLQWRILVLMSGGLGLILILSVYFHGLITRSLIEDDRYHAAVSRTVALAERVAALQLLADPAGLQRDIALEAEAVRDIQQIDVFQRGGSGLRLVASTAPQAARLPALDDTTADNELGEMERPLPEVVTMEVLRGGVRYWVITTRIRQRTGTGYVTDLVLKNSYSPLVQRLQFQEALVLGGAIIVCIGLSYIVFAQFFRRPARNIVQAMSLARGGNFSSRAQVRREDELGEIARDFNTMMDDLSGRDREREELLTRISGFNDQLRAEVDRATAELRAVNDALFQAQQRLGRSERLVAMGQVAATLAHEIGTPLNSIAGHVQLLARGLSKDVEAQRRVHIITQQLDSIVRSVRALLRRAHKPRASLRPLNLNRLVGDVLRLVGPSLQAHAIDVSVALDPTLPLVLADSDSLQQVFLNLINNSADAMPSGGRLEIHTRRTEPGFAEVTVRDTGSGVAPEAREHLFEPMWTTKATGSGFGLAIARGIMSEHGGTIDVESQSSAGAMFRLRLALATAAAPEAATTEEAHRA